MAGILKNCLEEIQNFLVVIGMKTHLETETVQGGTFSKIIPDNFNASHDIFTFAAVILRWAPCFILS